jgi:hypothetical protein
MFRLVCTKGVLSQRRVSARALLVAMAFCSVSASGGKERAVSVVSGSAQREC